MALTSFLQKPFAWLQRRLPSGVPEFLVVGSIGFVVDACILSVLIHVLDINPYLARVFSFAGAVSVTWLLNRIWTFSRTKTPKRGSEYSRYIGVQTCGAALNFCIYAACIATIPITSRYPVLALAVGSIIAATFNFLGARYFVFTGHKHDSANTEVADVS